MKNVIVISAIATLTLILGACNTSSTKNQTTGNSNADAVKMQSAKTPPANNFDTTKLVKGEAFYQCPMHPGEISNKPGSCSKCGMDLEKVVKQ